MHGNHPMRIQVEEGARGVCRISVYVAKRRWIVSPDGKQGKLRPQPGTNFAEAGEVRSIAGVIHGMATIPEHIAAITPVRVPQYACSPVAGRDMRDRNVPVTKTAPPVQLDHITKSDVGNQIEDMLRNHHRGCRSATPLRVLHKGAKRRPVQMIKMRVGDQHQVNRGEIANLYTWLPQTLEHK